MIGRGVVGECAATRLEARARSGGVDGASMDDGHEQALNVAFRLVNVGRLLPEREVGGLEYVFGSRAVPEHAVREPKRPPRGGVV